MATDLARQTLIGFTWSTVGCFAGAVTVSSQLASDACFGGMAVSALVVIVVYLWSARPVDPYRSKTESD